MMFYKRSLEHDDSIKRKSKKEYIDLDNLENS